MTVLTSATPSTQFNISLIEEDWSKAPFACPKCIQPFMRWSACFNHVTANKSCLKALTDTVDIYGLCEKTASSHSGTLRVPGAVQHRRRARRGSQTMSPVQETEEELQSIREDIERAVFGRSRPIETSACKVCSMSEPNCVLMPCMHSFACHSCTTVLRIDTCPICQTTLNGYQKI